MTTTFNIYRDDALIDSASSMSYLDTGLTNDTTYEYQVSAVVDSVEGPRSDPVSATPTGSAPGDVVQVAPGVTKSTLLGYLADTSVAGIEFLDGTYHGIHNLRLNVDRGVAHPISLYAQHAGDAVISGAGGSGLVGPFIFGYYGAGPASYITLDGFTIDSYAIQSTGLIYVGNCDHITLSNITVTNVTNAGTASTAHALYCGTDDGAGASNLVASNWTVTLPAHSMAACHFFHDPNVRTATFDHWDVTNGYRGVLAWCDATGLTFDHWTTDHADRAVDFANASGNHASGPTGTIANFVATNSGSAYQPGRMTLLSGNSWA